MKSKERMLTALSLGKPDHLPATLHQWRPYHLQTQMGGIDALEAFRVCGLDAQIPYQHDPASVIPELGAPLLCTPQWQDTYTVLSADPDNRLVEHTVVTPEGTLAYKTGGNRMANFILEPMVKGVREVELIEKYMPVPQWSKESVQKEYDRVGEAGILRASLWGDEPGCWQHACCLMGEQTLLFRAIDDPTFVHYFLKVLLDKKLRFIEESLHGARFDLVETGGGSGSDTFLSPAMHREFCLPYDQKLHAALHAAGQRVTYHLCGGMMFLLDCILQNGCDVSETLAPPGVGGNVREPEAVRAALGGKVAMLGGMDQFTILGVGTPEQVADETHRLFEGFGRDGGYICGAADHFFEAPVENLKAFAQTAAECRY